jgi:hypothetical protein
MIRALIVLVLLAPAGAARAQERAQAEVTQSIYASVENDIRLEHDRAMARVGRAETNEGSGRFEKIRKMWAMIFYNRAALFSGCAAEAEQYRSPGAPRVPARDNLLLTTCVEESLRALNKFSNMYSYADTFFPDRIERCGEASRLREREKLLPPYEFLQADEPKLYDFPRYNACLMTTEPTAPAAK